MIGESRPWNPTDTRKKDLKIWKILSAGRNNQPQALPSRLKSPLQLQLRSPTWQRVQSKYPSFFYFHPQWFARTESLGYAPSVFVCATLVSIAMLLSHYEQFSTSNSQERKHNRTYPPRKNDIHNPFECQIRRTDNWLTSRISSPFSSCWTSYYVNQ